MLLDDGLLFREPDSPAVLSTGGGRHWPEGRGVLLLQGSEGGNVWAWINEEEHFKLNIVPWKIWWRSLGNIGSDTSSTAQGGGGSFKNRKPIGEVGCCESGMAERSH